MKICIVGAGYVGLVTAGVFAEQGHRVFCVDVDEEKILSINEKIPPLAEVGLKEILEKYAGSSLLATMDPRASVKDSQVIFLCVQTPSQKNGAFDLSFLKKACRDVSVLLQDGVHRTIVIKSTVPPGTTEKIVLPALERGSKKKCGRDFGLCFSPEFLREGHAVEDTRKPSRLVFGSCDKRSIDVLLGLYRNYECKKIVCSPRTAEMIKLSSNAFLATKISFANEIGNLCKKIGTDVYEVVEGMVADPRISPAHLDAGLGFGGSCFPKDLRGLVAFSKKISNRPFLLESVIKVNEGQVKKFVDMVPARRGEKIGVLGLAFKRETDDVRDSQALHVIDLLLKKKALPCVYDPKGIPNTKKIYGPRLEYFSDPKGVVDECKKILVLTDWEEFSRLDYTGKIVFDARHVVKKKEGFEYHGMAW